MDYFSALLYDLGREFGEALYPDSNGICKLAYQGILHIQLEYFDQKKQILVASFLCEVPPGKYREMLFKEALKANDKFPRIGTLAYSERNNQFTLFAFLSTLQLNATLLSRFIEQFFAKALAWKESVEKGVAFPNI